MPINTELDAKSYLLGIEDSHKQLHYVLCHSGEYEEFCGIFENKQLAECMVKRRIDFLKESKGIINNFDDYYILPMRINKWV